MLSSMFPWSHARYRAVPVVGEFLDGLCAWLHARGHSRQRIMRRFEAATALSRALRRRAIPSLASLTAPELHAFTPPPGRRRKHPPVGALVHSLVEYLGERGMLAPTPSTPSQQCVAEYVRYLECVRGLSTESVRHHAKRIADFLTFLDFDGNPSRLRSLCGSDLEQFVAKTSRRVGRVTLTHIAGCLRSFLRYLAAQGAATAGLDRQVDTPRVWRLERLPRAMPRKTVLALLRSIDRSAPKGRRDYAMFLLLATYGLRAGEVAGLELDDVAWRSRELRVRQPKTGASLLLPLTDEVGAALLDYLKRDRPKTTSRQVFLRAITPIRPVRTSTIGRALAWWMCRSGLGRSGGTHSLRHSFAVHLLRKDTPLKTIGDLLGHRLPRSTGTYLRLQVDDLRGVALPLPVAATAGGALS